MAVLSYARRAIPAPGQSAARLVLLLGLLLAILLGYFASQGHDRLTLVIAIIVPILVVLTRYPWSGVLMWLAVMPFFVVGDGSVGPDTWLLHRLLIPVVLALSLTYRMLGLSRSHFRLSLTDAAIVAFLLLGLANIQLLSGNSMRMTAAFYDRLIVPIALYWLVRVVEPREHQLRMLLWVFVWLVILQCIVAALGWVAPGLLPHAWLGRVGERGGGTLGGPGPYSVTLTLGALLAIPFIATSRSQVERLALFGIAVTAFIGVAISFSRGSWLGAGLAFIGVAAAYRGLGARLVVGVLLLGAILLVGPMSNQVAFIGERLGDETTAQARVVTDVAAVRMIETRPLMGFGYGNFETVDESFKVRVGDIPVQEGSAHHAFLAFAAENGLPALVLYLFPAAWLLLLTLRRWRLVARDSLNRALVIMLWLALVDQAAVMNFMDMLHSSPWGTALWWLTLGLIHVVITRASQPPEIRRVGWTSVPVGV